MSGYFITGTDTGCGKTEASLGLMARLQSQGRRVLGMKPVATGCERRPEGLRNQDAERLLARGSTPAPYGLVNPYAFAPPIAPHLAAGAVGIEITLTAIKQAYRSLSGEADQVIVEGVGGWRVPLGPDLFVSDLPKALGLPVILVVGLRLGCINHALLTGERIRGDGCVLAGWIANQIDPEMLERDANLATLAALLDAPCLGVVPWLADPTPEVIGTLLNPDLIELKAVDRGKTKTPKPKSKGARI
jgi:dethiobiotin synthetase